MFELILFQSQKSLDNHSSRVSLSNFIFKKMEIKYIVLKCIWTALPPPFWVMFPQFCSIITIYPHLNLWFYLNDHRNWYQSEFERSQTIVLLLSAHYPRFLKIISKKKKCTKTIIQNLFHAIRYTIFIKYWYMWMIILVFNKWFVIIHVNWKFLQRALFTNLYISNWRFWVTA